MKRLSETMKRCILLGVGMILGTIVERLPTIFSPSLMMLATSIFVGLLLWMDETTNRGREPYCVKGSDNLSAQQAYYVHVLIQSAFDLHMLHCPLCIPPRAWLCPDALQFERDARAWLAKSMVSEFHVRERENEQ